MRSGLWLAIGALAVHLLWIVWVILGAVWTRNGRVLSVVHVLSLLYSIAIELLPWPCPLTLLEQWLRVRASAAAYEGSFLVHYLEAWIYPDVPEKVLVPAAIAVCCFNLAVYLSRARRRVSSRHFRGRGVEEDPSVHEPDAPDAAESVQLAAGHRADRLEGGRQSVYCNGCRDVRRAARPAVLRSRVGRGDPGRAFQ